MHARLSKISGNQRKPTDNRANMANLLLISPLPEPIVNSRDRNDPRSEKALSRLYGDYAGNSRFSNFIRVCRLGTYNARRVITGGRNRGEALYLFCEMRSHISRRYPRIYILPPFAAICHRSLFRAATRETEENS